MTKPATVILAGVVLLLPTASSACAQASAPDLTGLWAAQVRTGTGIRGPLMILRNGTSWSADIAGFRVPVRVAGQVISFELPQGKGKFRGRLSGQDIDGHWQGERSSFNGTSYGTLVTLTADGPNRWRGMLAPLENVFTFYMPVTRLPDGTYSTYLRNPERNQGRFIQVTGIRTSSDAVELIGRRGNQRDAVIAKGVYDDGVIRVALNGSSFDFEKIDSDSASAFYPRGKPPQRYTYQPPLKLDDGWPVGTVEDVGISRGGIEKLVQALIDQSMDSITSQQIHSVLIARQAGCRGIFPRIRSQHTTRPALCVKKLGSSAAWCSNAVRRSDQYGDASVSDDAWVCAG